MARKRYVSSGNSSNKKIAKVAEINPVAALMWPWFITNFDDWGRMKADPLEVKLEVFQAFPYTSKEIQDAILAFHEAGLAFLYEVNAKPYLAVEPSSWFEYQSYIQKKRQMEDKSKIPPPPNPPWENHYNHENTATNDDLEEDIADKLQTSTKIVLSPSLSPSLTEYITTTSEREEIQDSDDRDKDPINQVVNAYCDTHKVGQWNVKPKDFNCMMELIAGEVPSSFIISVMNKVHSQLSEGQRIHSFTYYKEPILQAWENEKLKQEGVDISVSTISTTYSRRDNQGRHYGRYQGKSSTPLAVSDDELDQLNEASSEMFKVQ